MPPLVDIFTQLVCRRAADINILGGDYCALNDVDLLVNYPNRRVKLLFGGKWKFTRESGDGCGERV
jgi:hypothetical protein